MGSSTPKLNLYKPAPGDAASTYDTEFPANMDTLDNSVVTTSTPAAGHLLYHNGSAWVTSGNPTTGDLIYYNGSAWVYRSAGASGTVLTSNGAGTAPTYQSVGGISHPDLFAHDYLRTVS